MKKTIFAVLLFTSSMAFADGVKYVCTKYDRATDKLENMTVVLQQTGAGELEEGAPMEFYLEVYEGLSYAPEYSAKGTVETEDVMFDFESKDGKITFHIYLDEMEESSLYINGMDLGDFVCY